MTHTGDSARFSLSCLILVSVLSSTDAAMSSDVQLLFDNKINHNNRNIKPLINQSETMHVNVSFNLVSITEFNEVDQRFSCNAWLDVYWMDELLKWNLSDYGGLKMVWPPNDKVWRPSLAVANIHNDFKTLEIKSGIVMLKHDGTAKWAPGEAFQTFCKVDVSVYPFDKQRCDIELFIWGMGLEEVVLYPLIESVNMDSYKKNGEWEIKETKIVQEVRGSSTIMSMVVVSFLLERRSLFYILNIVMPVLVLSILNVFVFIIPVESGEKLSFGVTVLLSFGVFMSFISDMLPQTSESVCLLAVYMACLLLLSAIFVALSIIITRVYYRDALGEPVPKWIQKLTRALACLSCQSRRKVHHSQKDIIKLEHIKLRDGPVMGKTAWDNTDDVTWRRVSHVLDGFCFCFFSMMIVAVTVVLLMKMTAGGARMSIDTQVS